MKLIEEVQIPLLNLPRPESYRLIRWRVSDGAHVTMGQVIFELESDDAVYEIESLHTGFMKISGIPGNTYKVGHSIGSVVCDQIPDGTAVFGIELALSEVSKLDALRGDRSRRDYLGDLIRAALTAPASE